MATRTRRRLKWMALPAALLMLLASLTLTRLGAWLATGAGELWQGFANLPGMAWAREQLAATPQPEPGPPQAEAPSQGSDSLRTMLRSGLALQEEGKLEDALRRYREALELDERYAPTHASLAGVYLQLGREEDALRELERAAELEPDNPYILAQLGRLYLKRDEYDKAVPVLERARVAEPGEANIRSLLGAAYYFRSRADIDKAVAELEKGVELAPADADVRFHLAMAYMQRDGEADRDRAIQSLEKALELDPAQTEAYYYLGLLYMRGGETDAAITAWQRYVSTSDDAAQVEQVRGWLRSLQKG